MNGQYGIIIDGKIFEAIPKGSYHCHDCDLYDYCEANPSDMGEICTSLNRLMSKRIFFRKYETDKLNEK